jgi:hypothetical protein
MSLLRQIVVGPRCQRVDAGGDAALRDWDGDRGGPQAGESRQRAGMFGLSMAQPTAAHPRRRPQRIHMAGTFRPCERGAIITLGWEGSCVARRRASAVLRTVTSVSARVSGAYP